MKRIHLRSGIKITEHDQGSLEMKKVTSTGTQMLWVDSASRHEFVNEIARLELAKDRSDYDSRTRSITEENHAEIESWIKRHRDKYGDGDPRNDALDDLLDDWRLHWQTGTPLNREAPDGPHSDLD